MHDGTTTLVIHDDATTRRRFVDTLSKHASRCIGLSTWPDDTLVGDVDPGVIVLHLPDDDAALITAARHQFPRARVIAVPSKCRIDLLRSACRAGAADCIPVPVDERDLIEAWRLAVESGASQVPTAPSDARGDLDAVTGLPSHGVFLDALEQGRADAQRRRQRLALVMFDLDHFHECNERPSRAFGDLVLRTFADTLRSICPPDVPIARYAADQFVVCLTDAREADAADLAARCRTVLRNHPVRSGEDTYELSVSVGIGVSGAGCVETGHQLIQRARIAAKRAKQTGGNRTAAWSEVNAANSSTASPAPECEESAYRRRRFQHHLRSTYMESTQALVAAIEARDPYTRAHSLTVASYAEAIGRRMCLSASMLEALRAAALLHDVGKIGVPDAILTKPGPLTGEEFTIVKRHPEKAIDILRPVSFLTDERPMILHHHERFNGSGYPAGLAGDRIPIGARILAVADALDTMLSPRTYKEPYGMDRVRDELRKGSGAQFDPTVTNVALRILDESPQLFETAAVVR